VFQRGGDGRVAERAGGVERIVERLELALGGGGLRGASHIGVLKVLRREGVPIDCIAGTSIGAIVGGLYSAGVSIPDLERIVQQKQMVRAYYTVPIWLRVAAIPVFSIPHLFGYSHYEGLYRGGKFRNYIDGLVDEKHQLIEQCNIPFCAVAASLMDGKSHAIYKGELARAVQASSAIPVLRRPVQIDDNLFVDGGIVNNLPIVEARNLGADVVIAVNIDQTFQDSNLKQFKKLGSVENRVIDMILSRVDQDSLPTADVTVHPKVNNIKLLSTRKSDAQKAISAGEEAAEQELANIFKAILRRSALSNANRLQ